MYRNRASGCLFEFICQRDPIGGEEGGKRRLETVRSQFFSRQLRLFNIALQIIKQGAIVQLLAHMLETAEFLGKDPPQVAAKVLLHTQRDACPLFKFHYLPAH